jgi:anti-anti-sigma factor
MKPFEAKAHSPSEGIAVLSISGELDADTGTLVERELKTIEESKPKVLVVDLRGLSFIDSTGLRLLALADIRARDNGRRLALIPGEERIQRVFRITGLDNRLDFAAEPSDFGLR